MLHWVDGGEAVSAVATSETAAAKEPGGPQGPQTPSTEWLILQRLDDIRRAQDQLRTDMKEQVDDIRRAQDQLRADMKEQVDDIRRAQDELRADVKALDAKLDAKIESVRGQMYLFLVPIILAILGLLAKLLIPGA